MTSPTRATIRWVEVLASALEFPRLTSVAALLLSFASSFGGLWTFAEACGASGSMILAVILASISGGLVVGLAFVVHALRWTLLFASVKAYVRKHLGDSVITRDTVLLGIGPGSGIVVGMISKALQILGRPIPQSITVDCQYTDSEYPEVGALIKGGLKIKAAACLIVLSYVGTGRSLRAAREKYELDKAKVFSIVVSEAVAEREEIDFYLVVGTRSLIPWPKSVA